MNFNSFSDITQQAIRVTLYVSSPMLLVALFMGIIVSLFQAVTQINEQTLSFIPKIMAIAVCLIILAPWMSEILTNFTRELILNIPHIIGQR